MSEGAGGERRRALTVLDCIGIGVNGIIGSGIFFLPSAVFRHGGGASPLAWLLVGGVCFLVGLSFAQAAGHTDRSGGPYAYARLAFGRELGFAVGFVALSSMLLGYAAVMRGLVENVAAFAPAVRGHEWGTAVVIIAVLAGINLLGIKPGANTSNLFSAAKVVPLLLLVAIGLTAMNWSALSAPPAPREGEGTGLVSAAMAGLFACTGFEFVGVLAGETRRPARAIPVALLGSLGGAVLLYALLQLVAVGTTPDLGSAEPALVVVARHAGGAWLSGLVAIGATVSALGFAASSVLIAPGFLSTLAEDDLLPSPLAWRRPSGTPVVAIVVYATIGAFLVGLGDFQRIADIANIAAVVQYLSTTLAVLVLRRRRPAHEGAFQPPLGPLLPLLATAGCLLFLQGVRAAEAKACAAVVATGFVLRLLHLGVRRLAPRGAGGAGVRK